MSAAVASTMAASAAFTLALRERRADQQNRNRQNG
jgi:hypothetical protein